MSGRLEFEDTETCASGFARNRFTACLILVISLHCSAFLDSKVVADTRSPADSGDAEPTDITPSEEIFVRQISTLLAEKCLGCHGLEGREIEGGLDLGSLRSCMEGGDSGEPAIDLMDPTQSPLYLAAARDSVDWSAMPPKESEKLTAGELEAIRTWLDSGAAWPSAERQQEIQARFAEQWTQEDGVAVQTSGGTTDLWTKRKYAPADLWSFQPILNPFDSGDPDSRIRVQPEGGDDVSPRKGEKSRGIADRSTTITAIDDLLAELRPAMLKVAPRAERSVLVRRACYDLTGLPPSAEQVRAFCDDPRSDEIAFADLVDRLLASDHYGERMAQHWLDVVRYADSSGFANDFERGNAWRYRDYVVRSFNRDKPFDQFVIEQIAGDEWFAEDSDALTETDAMVALGFLRMGPWELTGMEVAKVARQRFLDDVTNSVGEVFLGHSLQCAKCHDHKFDPIPTRDYYGIQAVFATTQLAERRAEFLDHENQDGFEEQEYLRRKQAEHSEVLASLDAVLLENATEWFEAQQPVPQQAFDRWKQEVDLLLNSGRGNGVFNAVRQVMQGADFSEDEYPPRHVGFTPEQFGRQRVASKGIQRLKWEFDRYQPFALSVYSGRTPKRNGVYAPTRIPKDRFTKGELEETCILTGGDPFSESERVHPSVLSVVQESVTPEIPESIEGRRLAFARWVASDENPLTARVIANRLWLWHFGKAIAGNPNNFGSKGKKPTHPRLLDWLAASLINEGWSLKSLHRQIMLSDAYCRSSQHDEPTVLDQLDPNRESYSVFMPRRLSAEELRDSMLFVSGELNHQIGGIPCRPEINQEVALQPRQVMGAFAAAWVPNPEPKQRHRRSLYILRLRGLVDPLLEVFNAPSPDFSCEFRDASTITPQVFALFNGVSTYRRALAIARRAVLNSETQRGAIEQCFRMIYSRDASDQEIQIALNHWQLISDKHDALPVQEILASPPLEVVREAVEENTGERFTFIERLEANADYVPDLRAEEITPQMQGLADVCLVLLNSNEFVYVD